MDRRAPLTFSALRRLSVSLQPVLARYAGLRVAASLPNGPELAALALALTGLGVAFGPLNPDLSPSEMLFELSDLPAAALIVLEGGQAGSGGAREAAPDERALP